MGLLQKVRFFCGMLLLATGCSGVGSAASSETKNGSPPAIGSCPKGSDYKDGCSGASAGVPAFPSLLSGYTAQPPWNVAGVHYAVGVPSLIPLKDPTTAALPSGCSLNGTTVTCSGTVTLDGYDFSLHNGTTLSIRSG